MNKLITITLIGLICLGPVSESFAAKKDKDKQEQAEAGKKKKKKKKGGDDEETSSSDDEEQAEASTSKKKKKKKLSKADIAALQSNYESAKAQLEATKKEKSELEAKVTNLLEETYDLKEELKKSTSGDVFADDAGTASDPEGLAFRIQVGAFEQIRLQDYMNQPKQVSVESEGDLSKYTIGYFEDFQTAQDVEGKMKRIGFSDAWLVPYKNGVRISDEEAEEILGVKIRPE